MAKLTMAQVAAVAADSGWTGGDLVTAVAVEWAEAGGDPNAIHTNIDGSKDYGLWQINDRAHSGGKPPPNWADPHANGTMAHGIWSQAHGFTPWATFKDGAYLLYKLQASQAIQSLGARNPAQIIGDQLSGAGDAAAQTADSVTGAVRLAAQTGQWVSDPRNWLRVVYVAAGLALIVGGLVVAAGGTGALRPALRAVV